MSSQTASKPVETSLTALREIVPARDIIEAEQASPFAVDESRALAARPMAVVFPRSHEQVCEIVRWARDHRIALVPSGGRTGLSGGACAGSGEVVVSMNKMDQVLAFDPVAGLVKVEAGVILQNMQEYVEQRGWHYPVDYPSKGTAQMGGAVATNAGGIRVLRYGMTRQWVAGIKAVDGRGETLEVDRCLVKDNSGYSLKDLLVGSEGTLAIITEVTFRLTRPMHDQHTLLLGIRDLDHMIEVFSKAMAIGQPNAAEFLNDAALRVVTDAHTMKSPFHEHYPYYLLLEYDEDAIDIDHLALAFEDIDVIVGRNQKQKDYIWSLRELVSSTLNPSKPYKNDVACRLSHLKEWLHGLENGLRAVSEHVQFVWFGHLGDGNVHVNVVPGEGLSREEFDALFPAFDQVILDLVGQYPSTVSAEHGIGVLKKKLLPGMLSAHELALYRGIKAAFDPDGILNPGNIFDA